jgi:alpha-tubulin suppressor-like RCC1 family protein
VTHSILWRYLISPALGSFILACGGDSTSPPAATKLAFEVQPTLAPAGVAITPAVRVSIRDAQGKTVTGANTRVTIGFAPGSVGAALTGTTSVNAVAGVATFTDLGVDIKGTDYRLVATAPGSEQATSDPFSVFLAFDVVSASVAHACGIAAQRAYCWGVDNTLGALGDGTTTSRLTTTLTGGNQKFVDIDVGTAHTCALTATGSAYCWGANGSGQIGDGTGTARFIPTPVSGGITFASISAGWAHTCGVTPAGAAYCWGQNFKGQLGNGTTNTALTPVAVAGGLTFTAVSAGSEHTCGITTGNVAYCWGLNDGGELGNGTTTRTATPTQVSGSWSFAGISAGVAFTCATTTVGAAYCWGTNTSGQLGDGTMFYRMIPTPVSGGIVFASVGVGGPNSCGLTSSGAAYCWGENGSGQVGDGTQGSPKLAPTSVSGGLIFRSLSVGSFLTCGVTPANETYCWGSNENGVFGDGNQFNGSSTPRRAAF